MAVHGALLTLPDSPGARAGYLVSARGVQLHVSRLDDIAADLLVDASCILFSDEGGFDGAEV
jgi:predicted hotdog family 3-hydroxylacyl-ACP dehydratase